MDHVVCVLDEGDEPLLVGWGGCSCALRTGDACRGRGRGHGFHVSKTKIHPWIYIF